MKSTAADVVINLAGRSVNCRYHAANRRQMIDSRVQSTRVVGQAIAQRVATAARLAAGEHGDDLRASLRRCQRRSAPACSAATNRTRPTPGGSASTSRAPGSARSTRRRRPDAEGRASVGDDDEPRPRRHLRHAARPRPASASAAVAGDGRQFISWIHHEDFVRAVRWLIDHDDIDGAVNVASPNPLPNAEFMRMLREAAGVTDRTYRRAAGCSRSARCSCARRPS